LDRSNYYVKPTDIEVSGHRRLSLEGPKRRKVEWKDSDVIGRLRWNMTFHRIEGAIYTAHLSVDSS
jgi:hypothetical protein